LWSLFTFKRNDFFWVITHRNDGDAGMIILRGDGLVYKTDSILVPVCIYPPDSSNRHVAQFIP
jgi:hypothetical protein